MDSISFSHREVDLKMARVALFVCLQLCLVLLSQGKTFDRCGLARELDRQGFPRHQLADWVCLVEAESSRRTDVIGPTEGKNRDGSRDHGLFQINDHYWCEDGPRPGKGCNLRCSDVRTDDITAASKCAKKIFKVHGFNAWMGWVDKCMDKALPDLRPCGF